MKMSKCEGWSRLEHDDCILNNYGVGVPFGISVGFGKVVMIG